VSCSEKDTKYLVDFKIFKDGVLASIEKVDIRKKEHDDLLKKLNEIVNDENSYFEITKEISSEETIQQDVNAGKLKADLKYSSSFKRGPYFIVRKTKNSENDLLFEFKHPEHDTHSNATDISILLLNEFDNLKTSIDDSFPKDESYVQLKEKGSE